LSLPEIVGNRRITLTDENGAGAVKPVLSPPKTMQKHKNTTGQNGSKWGRSNMTRNRNSYLNHSAWDACLKGESAIMVARESAGAPEGHREDFVFELQNQ